MDKKEKKEYPAFGMREAVSAAICISSVSLFGASAAAFLTLSVIFGLLAGTVTRMILKNNTACKTSEVLLLSSTSLAAANVASAYLGLAELPRGVFSACAVAAAFILSRASEGGTAGSSVKGAFVYALAVTAAGAVAEILGLGQVFGVRLPMADGGYVGVFSTPAGGMMICAVAAAVCKYIMKKSEDLRRECKR